MIVLGEWYVFYGLELSEPVVGYVCWVCAFYLSFEFVVGVVEVYLYAERVVGAYVAYAKAEGFLLAAL